MRTPFAPVLLAALVVVGITAARAQTANLASTPTSVPVLAQLVDSTDPADVPTGMTVVFVPPAGDGFADGGDGLPTAATSRPVLHGSPRPHCRTASRTGRRAGA